MFLNPKKQKHRILIIIIVIFLALGLVMAYVPLLF